MNTISTNRWQFPLLYEKCVWYNKFILKYRRKNVWDEQAAEAADIHPAAGIAPDIPVADIMWEAAVAREADQAVSVERGDHRAASEAVALAERREAVSADR
jgi:hypothetical protein